MQEDTGRYSPDVEQWNFIPAQAKKSFFQKFHSTLKIYSPISFIVHAYTEIKSTNNFFKKTKNYFLKQDKPNTYNSLQL